jgi:hypothetical protein
MGTAYRSDITPRKRTERSLRRAFGDEAAESFSPVEWHLLVYIADLCRQNGGSDWVFRDAAYDALHEDLGFSVMPNSINAAVESLSQREAWTEQGGLFDMGTGYLITIAQGLLGDGWPLQTGVAGAKDGEAFAWEVSLGPALRCALAQQIRP